MLTSWWILLLHFDTAAYGQALTSEPGQCAILLKGHLVYFPCILALQLLSLLDLSSAGSVTFGDQQTTKTDTKILDFTWRTKGDSQKVFSA